jgi:hypothetical protein
MDEDDRGLSSARVAEGVADLEGRGEAGVAPRAALSRIGGAAWHERTSELLGGMISKRARGSAPRSWEERGTRLSGLSRGGVRGRGETCVSLSNGSSDGDAERDRVEDGLHHRGGTRDTDDV